MLPKLRFAFAAATLALTSIFGTALSDTYRYGNVIYDDSTPDYIYFVGPISENQAYQFRVAMRKHEFSTVVLYSPGGNVDEGLKFSRYINGEDLNTVIPKNALCASACSYLFFAGVERIALGDLGVHQFRTNYPNLENEDPEDFLFLIEEGVLLINDILLPLEQDTQEFAGEIIKQLIEFDVPPFIFEKMLTTEPREMYWLNADEREAVSTGSACISKPKSSTSSGIDFASIVTSTTRKETQLRTVEGDKSCRGEAQTSQVMIEMLSEKFRQESNLNK